MIKDNKRLEIYFSDKNVDSIYKILPLYEESNENLDSYISSLLIELYGLESCVNLKHQEFISMVAVVSGIKSEINKADNHKIVKREVFKAIEISKLLAVKVVD